MIKSNGVYEILSTSSYLPHGTSNESASWEGGDGDAASFAGQCGFLAVPKLYNAFKCRIYVVQIESSKIASRMTGKIYIV